MKAIKTEHVDIATKIERITEVLNAESIRDEEYKKKVIANLPEVEKRLNDLKELLKR